MDRIAILGSRGFIGNGLLIYLKSRLPNSEIFGLSSLDLDLEKTNESFPLEKSSKQTTLIICSGLKRNHGDTLEIFERNMKIAHNLHLLTARLLFKKIIYLSSCSVYGEDVAHPIITEDQALTPTSFYGISKASTEFLLQKSCSDRLVILRPPTIYGAFANPQNYDPYGFLNRVFNNSSITLWGDGKELREFLYINDLFKIIECLLNLSFTGTLNICSGKSYSFIDILNEVQTITGKIPRIESRTRSKEKIDNYYSAKKIHSVLPNLDFTELKTGISEIFHKEFAR